MIVHSGQLTRAACHSSASVLPPALRVVVLDAVINDDFVHRFQSYELDYVKPLAQFRRADELDAEAAYSAAGRGCRPGRDGAAAPDRERSDVVSAAESARRRRRRVPALHAGPVTPPRPRSTRWRWRSGWVAVGAPASGRRQQCPPPRAPGARSGQPARCRHVPGGGPWVQLARGVLEVSTRRVRPRGLCALRRKPRHPRATKTASQPPCPRPDLWQTADASLSCRRTGPAVQTDLPQPPSEGPPT